MSNADAHAASTDTAAVEAVECAHHGCTTRTSRALTREFIEETTEIGVATETTERVVCARHYYREQIARELVWWSGFALFALLMLPSMQGWELWEVLF